LREQVADHALTLGAKDVERVGSDGFVGVGFEGEQSDLWAVAVCDHELVFAGEGGQGGGGLQNVLPLGFRLRRLAAAQKGVAAERDNEPHAPARVDA